MGLWTFFREKILLKERELKRGSLALGLSFHLYFRKSFVVSQDVFKLISTAIETAIASNCADEEHKPKITTWIGKRRLRETTFNSLEDLTSYFNAADNRLHSVAYSISTRSMGCLVEFQDTEPGWTAAIVVEGGSEDQAKELIEKLTSYVKETFQWYSFISSARITLIAVAVQLTWSIYKFSSQFSPDQLSISDPSQVPTSQRILSILSVLAIVAVLIPCWIGFMVLIDALFPRGTFLVGQEVHRNNRIVWWRKALLTGLVFPFLIALYRTIVE